MKKKSASFNDRLALKITTTVSTMWCAYLFAILALIALPAAINGGVLTVIQWVSQTFLQLVMLSVIMVGQDLIGGKTEARAQQDHKTIMAEMSSIKDLQQEMHEVLKKLGCEDEEIK